MEFTCAQLYEDTISPILSYASRNITALPKIILKEGAFHHENPILFVHTPKTGGANIGYLIKAITMDKGYEYITAYTECSDASYKSSDIVTRNCTGGLESIKNNPSAYDLSENKNIKFVIGTLPLIDGSYFKSNISAISLVRSPADREMSLVNYFFDKGLIKIQDIEHLLLHEHIDNLQTRFLAGEEYMWGNCTEETLEQAKKNINEKFELVVPIKDVELLVSIIAGSFGYNIALAKPNISGAKIISKNNTELAQKILEKNMYDLRLYDYVENYWESWKSKNIISTHTVPEHEKYMVLSSEFYMNDSLQWMNLENIKQINKENHENNEEELISGKQKYWTKGPI